MVFLLIICVPLVLLSHVMIGCYTDGNRGAESGTIDLLRLFTEQAATEVSRLESQVRIYTFVRNGQRRQTLTLIADAEIALPEITVPPRAKLVFALAMPFNLGDGAEARVYFQGKHGRDLLFARYLDPARRRQDRSWHAITVDLSAYAGKSGQIVLQAQGTTRELTADWVGWAELKIQ